MIFWKSIVLSTVASLFATIAFITSVHYLSENKKEMVQVEAQNALNKCTLSINGTQVKDFGIANSAECRKLVTEFVDTHNKGSVTSN